MTKDADIVDSHLLLGKPAKLMLISLGNSRNAQLEAVLVPLIPIIATAFSADTFLEIGLTGVVVRG